MENSYRIKLQPASIDIIIFPEGRNKITENRDLVDSSALPSNELDTKKIIQDINLPEINTSHQSSKLIECFEDSNCWQNISTKFS